MTSYIEIEKSEAARVHRARVQAAYLRMNKDKQYQAQRMLQIYGRITRASGRRESAQLIFQLAQDCKR